MANSTLANPAPLGLMGFGMTTVLLNLHNAGLFTMDVAILAMGIFMVGLRRCWQACWSLKRITPLG